MTKHIRQLVLLLSLWFAGGAAVASSQQEAIEAHLRLVIQQQPLVLAALYGLSETTAVFTAIAPERMWSTYRPEELPGLLIEEEREDVITAIAAQLGVFPDSELEGFFGRMRQWLLAHEQLSVYSGLTSLEQTMAATFALPLTQGLFDNALESRGLDPEEVASRTVGETLAPAEMAVITYDLLRVLSSLSQQEQLRFYRDVYDQLLELLDEGV